MKSSIAPSWRLIFLVVLVGILLGSGAYTAYYANGLSYLSNDPRACQTCHRYPEEEILARAEAIQTRTKSLMDRAEIAVMDLIDAIAAVERSGADAAALDSARRLHRRSQWRLDYVAAENSMGFHASQEAARILAEAIDLARQGQIALPRPEKAGDSPSQSTDEAAE